VESNQRLVRNRKRFFKVFNLTRYRTMGEPMKTQETVMNTSESRLLHTAAAILLTTALVGVTLLGCSNSSDSSGELSSSTKGQQPPVPNAPPPPPPPVTGQQESATDATPVMEPVMIAWQKGDKSTAVNRFVEANWSARPLFAPGTIFSLSESQFTALSSSDRNTKANDAINQVGELKQLARAVAQAGRDAAMKNDSAQARKCFNSLKQCGEALDGPDSLLLARQLGKALKTMAGEELEKIKQ
jgi:hypothetical protein